MASSSTDPLDEIYQLSDIISEAQARIAVIKYNERRSGLTAEMMHSNQIRKLQSETDQAELQRREKIMRYYSNWKPNSYSTSTPPSPSLNQESVRTPTPPPRSPSTDSKPASEHQSVDNETAEEEETVTEKSKTPEDTEPLPEPIPSPTPTEENEPSPDPTSPPPPEEDKWLTEPMPLEEKAYYEKCKQYRDITGMPIMSISDDIFDRQTELLAASLVCVIDVDSRDFDDKDFLNQIRSILNLDDISITKMQRGCVKVVFEIFKKVNSELKKIEVRAVYDSMTDEKLKELEKLHVLFMFMGDIEAFYQQQSFRNQLTLHPKWNRKYGKNYTYWEGDLHDGKDRGDRPYFCPVGWQRFSFHVSDHFYDKFKGWCVCYHGTKFAYGLSILLSGLAPAKVVVFGEGIYTSPSIIYTAHPRYAEIKDISSANVKSFFKNGKYAQFVLQCRVHPTNRTVIDQQTLGVKNSVIDPNVSNDKIEWLIDAKGKTIMDFNDPDSTIVCTGLMVRITDNHPGLLPESQWWSDSILYDSAMCGGLDIDLNDLDRRKLNGESCNIVNE